MVTSCVSAGNFGCCMRGIPSTIPLHVGIKTSLTPRDVQLCGVRLRAVVHGKRALSERSQSATTSQRKGGVGDSAANVRRDLADDDCGDGGDCKLRSFPVSQEIRSGPIPIRADRIR